MRKVNFKKSDMGLVEEFIKANSDKPIYIVYKEIKSKKFKERSKAENIVFTYLTLNKRKLGIRD